MSDHKKKKAKTHKVELVFKGKHFFFKVTNNKGESYDVAVQVKCTCRFCAVQGIANGDVCSYGMAACKKISDGEI